LLFVGLIKLLEDLTMYILITILTIIGIEDFLVRKIRLKSLITLAIDILIDCFFNGYRNLGLSIGISLGILFLFALNIVGGGDFAVILLTSFIAPTLTIICSVLSMLICAILISREFYYPPLLTFYSISFCFLMGIFY